MERPSYTRQDTDLEGVDKEKKAYGISTSIDSKGSEKGGNEAPPPIYHDTEAAIGEGPIGALETAEDIVTQVIHTDDDPTINPWTFRMFFIGLGLSAFGAVLQEIFYFKPQVIYVSVMFLTVIAHAIGEFMSLFIPRWGSVGRFLNPGPWNKKEHAAAVLMASAASQSALSTEALAVQKLFYGGYPNTAAGVFITMSSQLIGFGIAGMMRSTLLWPTKMLYPANLSITTVLETLHRDKSETRKRLKVFWIVFAALFFWEFLPEYIFPLLIGVSVFCLADQHNLVFTNLFGGTNGNEGMGLLSISFDWNYIAGFGSPLWLPLQTLTNSFIGYLGGIALSIGLYYSNVWRSHDLPFMSQLLFDKASNSTNFVTYNTTTIFDASYTIDNAAVEAQGIPYLTGTYIAYLITSNAGLTATVVHMFLWNYNDIKVAWEWITLDKMKSIFKPSAYAFWKNLGPRSVEEKERVENDPTLDPHFKVMVSNDYEECPTSWYAAAFAASWITGITCLYVMKSTLPWWGFILATVFTFVFMVFFGAQAFFQMIAGYCFPGKPLANMYFTTYTYSGLQQGQYLLRDLKLGQQNKLSPKCAFVTQVLGCLFGALLNYVMMISIVKNQADVLRSIEGTPIWSGANIQNFNSLAISWSIAPKMFSIGTRYQWVTASFLIGPLVPIPFYIMHRYYPQQRIWSYLNLSIILWYLGYLYVGINSSILSYYLIGYFGQWYLRKYRPKYFVKWNYLVSAAMDGGTQVLLFLLTFAVAGGSGTAHPFPTWAGNSQGNVDRCAFNEASTSSA